MSLLSVAEFRELRRRGARMTYLTWSHMATYPHIVRTWSSWSPIAFCHHALDVPIVTTRLGQPIPRLECDVVVATVLNQAQAEVLSTLGIPVFLGGPGVSSALLESALEIDTSSTVSAVWSEEDDVVVLSLGWGCSHNGCVYCSARGPFRARPDVRGILRQIQLFGEVRFFLLPDGPPAWMLAEIIASHGPAFLNAFARPPELYRALQLTSCGNDRLWLSVGAEATSDRTLRILGRCHSVADTWRAVDAALTRGIRIVLLLMGPHSSDTLADLDQFKLAYEARKGPNLRIRWTGPTTFPRRHSSDDVLTVEEGRSLFMRRVPEVLCEWWEAFIAHEEQTEESMNRYRILRGVA